MAIYGAIMQLSLAGRSYAEIVEMVGFRRDVALVKKTISRAGITSERALSITDAEIGQLFPDGRRKVSQEYDQPDFMATVTSNVADRTGISRCSRRGTAMWVRLVQARSTGIRSTARCSQSRSG